MPKSNFEKAKELGIPVGDGQITRKGVTFTYHVLFPHNGDGIRADSKRATIVIYIWSEKANATVEDCIKRCPKRGDYGHSQRQYWNEYGRKSIEKNLRDAGFALKQSGKFLLITRVSASRATQAHRRQGEGTRTVRQKNKPATVKRLISAGKALAAMQKLDTLDGSREALIRAEQHYWRPILFGSENTGKCGICGRKIPVELLIAAHIKRRSSCSDSEKMDRANIMPMCKLGCDDLFERGYVTVEKGRIVANPRMPRTSAVARYVRGLVGRKCTYWSRASSHYFEAHNEAHSHK